MANEPPEPADGKQPKTTSDEHPAPTDEQSTVVAKEDSEASAETSAQAEPAEEAERPGPPPTLPKGPAVASTWTASHDDEVTVPGPHRLRVAAQSDEGSDRSILWAQPITKAGAPAGPAVQLRETTGRVDAISAVFDGVTLWVGWRARLREDDRGLEGLAGYDLSLTQTVKARSLRFFRYGEAYSDQSIRLVARPGPGAGVMVVAIAGSVRCKGMDFEELGWTECPQLAIDVVAADGTVELTKTSELEGGDPSFDITPGAHGLAIEFIAYRGGANTDTLFVSFAAEAGELTTCSFPPPMLVWVDDGLLSLCRDADLTDEIELSCSPSNISACGTFYYERLPGKKATLTIPEAREINFDRLALGCKDNAPTLRISWKGGHIDAAAAGLFSGPDAVMEGGKCKGRSL